MPAEHDTPPGSPPAAPHQGTPPASPTSSHRRAAFEAVTEAVRVARAGGPPRAPPDEQPEAEPEGLGDEEEETHSQEDRQPGPFGNTPPELFQCPASPPQHNVEEIAAAAAVAEGGGEAEHGSHLGANGEGVTPPHGTDGVAVEREGELQADGEDEATQYIQEGDDMDVEAEEGGASPLGDTLLESPVVDAVAAELELAGEERGSAPHRRRWSGLRGGEAGARERGGMGKE